MEIKTKLVCILLIIFKTSFGQIEQDSSSTSTDILSEQKINLLFEKYGEKLYFKYGDSLSTINVSNPPKILIVKNGPTSKPKLSFRIGFYGNCFAFIFPGLEADLCYETYHHKFDFNTVGTMAGNDFYTVKGTYTFNYMVKDLHRNSAVKADYFARHYDNSYRYFVQVNKKIKFKMGNYFGFERYLNHDTHSSPAANFFGFTYHFGTSFNWLSDVRIIGDIDKKTIVKESKEDYFYFEYQYSSPDNLNFNGYFAHGGIAGFIRKFYKQKYSALNQKTANNRFWYIGVEGGALSGPYRAFDGNVAVFASRIGIGI